MLLGGLWHEAAWTFVLWGLYQGLRLVAFVLVLQARRRGKRWRLPAARAAAPRSVGKWLKVAGMFHPTCLGWLIFRAKSVPQIAQLAGALVGRFSLSGGALRTYGLPLLCDTALLAVIHTVEARRDDLSAVSKLPPAVRYAVYAAMVYCVVLFGDFAGSRTSSSERGPGW